MQQFQFDDKFFRDRGNDYFRREDYHPALLLYSFCIGLIDKTTKDKTANAKVLCNRTACWRKLSAMQSAYDDAWNALKCDKKYWRSYHWLAQIYKDIDLLDYVPRVVAACFANCPFPADEFGAGAAVEMYIDYLEAAAPAGYDSQLRSKNCSPLKAATSSVGVRNGGVGADALMSLGLSGSAWNCLLVEMKRQQRRPQLAFTLSELRRQTGPSALELVAPFNDPTYLIDLAGGDGAQSLRPTELVDVIEGLSSGGAAGWNASLFDRVWPSLTPDRVTEPAHRVRVANSLMSLALALAPHNQQGGQKIVSCSTPPSACPLARHPRASRAVSLGIRFSNEAPPILHLLAGHILLAKSASVATTAKRQGAAASSAAAAAASSKSAATSPSEAARLAARAYLTGLSKDPDALKSLGASSAPLLSNVLAEIAGLLDGESCQSKKSSTLVVLRKAFLRSAAKVREPAIWSPVIQHHLVSRNYLALCQLLAFGSAEHRFSGPALEPLRTVRKGLCRSAPTKDLLGLPAEQWTRYGERLLVLFCLLGLDPNASLTGQLGNTCFHTAIARALLTGSLDLYRFLFYFHRPRSSDKTGDTLLHLIGAAKEASENSSSKYSKDFACTAIQLLVRYGHADPRALNKRGRKPVDYYKPSDAEYGYLQYPDTCLNYSDPGERVINCWFYYFAQRLGIQPERTELLLADAAKIFSGDGEGAYLCKMCEESLQKHRNLSKRDELLHFYGTLLHEDHKREFSKSHADLICRLLPDLLELLSQGDLISPRIIPDRLLQPTALLACLIHGLITLDANTTEDGVFKCWKSIHVLLKCYFNNLKADKAQSEVLKPTLEHGLRMYLGVHSVEAVVNDARQGRVAASVKLQDLLMSGYQRGDQSKRLDLVDLLRQAGAHCDLSGLELADLLRRPGEQSSPEPGSQRQGFARDLPQLMERGLLGPDCLGDYPLHKAILVALEIEPGYFELFEYLLVLYKTDPESNPRLDPRLCDSEGNTLYHTAASIRSRHSVEAVRKLAELTEANPNLRNRARQTALQAINRSVRRRERQQLVLQLTQAAARFPEPEPVDTRPDLGADDEASGDDSDADSVNEASETASSATSVQSSAVGGNRQSLTRQQRQQQDSAGQQQQTPQSQFEQTLQWFHRQLDRFTKDDIVDRTRNAVRAPNPRELAAAEESSDAEEEQEDEADADIVANADDDRQPSPSDELAGSDDEAGSGGVNATMVSDGSELDWEIECTVELWNMLRRRRNTWRHLRRRLAARLLKLASGRGWRSLAKPVPMPNQPGGSDQPSLSLQFYQTSLGGQASLLWERAVTFSPKRSGPHGKIYCDVLRLWAIVESPEALAEEVARAVTAHRRGAACALARQLNAAAAAAATSAAFSAGSAPSDNRILPRTYSVVSNGGGGSGSELVRFQPPGASKETEYHMMKFYGWDASLIADILTGDARVDLPFRVTEQEHAVIELSSDAPVLLIGRSGTGKTTCCVFRMFSAFSHYWHQAGSVDNPLIPRTRLYRLVEPDAANDGAQSDEDADENSGDETDPPQQREPRGRWNRGRGARNRNRAANSNAAEADEAVVEVVASGQADQDADRDGQAALADHLRQLFVTKNPVLCREVRKNFHDLCAGLRDVNPPEPEFELPNRLQQASSAHFPMFVSSKQLWMLLDASLPGQPFFQRNEDGSLAKRVPGWEDEEADIEFLLDTNADDLFDAANYYDDAGANGEGAEAGAGGANGANNTADQQSQQQQEDRRREVTYELFSTSLWDRLPSKLRSGLQPSLVWTELVSFIKGSVEALNSPTGFLSLEKYCEIGRKRAPEFADSRERVYRLFEEYQRLLRDLCLFDMSDLVANLYRRQTDWLKEAAAPTPDEDWALHAIFVDETQDFTQAELSLLLRCCQDPNKMFFTGDTAQSIMRGVSFRFTDLKTLFHYARRGLQSQGAAGSLRMPDGLQVLTHNYRSHSGILGLASCVILLLGRLFPSTFDPLEPDMGLFPGPKPVLIESCSATDLAFLLQGARRKSNAHIDFGAHQAIIVASDEARRYLVENVPELSIALVLTVYESKGLEFDDVLLYNFFKDSPAGEKDWRVASAVLRDLVNESSSSSGGSAAPAALLKQLDLAEYAKRSSRPIEFSAGEHKILNSVLKHLYTAVTRARVNVWIFDEDVEVRKPMFEFFKTMQVVNVVATGSESLELSLECADGFAATSSPEQWRAKGHEFYCRRLFDLAAKCYNRSGDSDLKQLAEANGKALRALKLTEPKQQREEFVAAARIYLKLGWAEQAAKCLEHGKQPLLAANLFQLLGQYNRVFRVFDKSQNYIRAAEALQMLGRGAQAARYLLQHRLYLEAFEARQQAKREAEQRCAGDAVRLEAELAKLPDDRVILLRGAKAYKQENNKEKLAKMVQSLPLEERVMFFVEHNELLSAAAAYASENQKREAAQFLYDHGKIKDAWQYAQEADDDQLLSQCATALAEQAYARWQRKRNEETLSKAKEALERGVGKAELIGEHQDAGYCRLLLGEVTRDIHCLQQAFTQMRRKNCEIGLVYILSIVCQGEGASILGEDPDTRAKWMCELLLPLRYLGDLIINFSNRCSNPNLSQIQRTYRFLGLTEKARLMDLQLRVAGHPLAKHLLLLAGRSHKGTSVARSEINSCVFSFCENLIGDAFPMLFMFWKEELFERRAYCPSQSDATCLKALSIESSKDRCAYQHGNYETPEQFRDMALAAGCLLRLGRLLHQHSMSRANRLREDAQRSSVTRNYIQRMENKFKYNDYVIMYVTNVYPQRPVFETRHPVIRPAIAEFVADIDYFCDNHLPGGYGERLLKLRDSLVNRSRFDAAAAARAAQQPALDPDSLPEMLRQFVPTEEFCGICGLQLLPDEEVELDLPQASVGFGFSAKLPSVSAHQSSEGHLQRLSAFKRFAAFVAEFYEMQRHWESKLDEVALIFSARTADAKDGGGVDILLETLQNRRAHLKSGVDRLDKTIESDVAKQAWERYSSHRNFLRKLRQEFHEHFVRYFGRHLPGFSFSQSAPGAAPELPAISHSPAAAAAANQSGAFEDDDMDLQFEVDYGDEKPYDDKRDEFRVVQRKQRQQQRRNYGGGGRQWGGGGRQWGGGGRQGGGGGRQGGGGGEGHVRTFHNSNLPPRFQKARGQ